MTQQAQSKLFYLLLTLLLAVMGFAGQRVYSHEQRITTIEERVPTDLKVQLTRIETKLDGLTVTRKR